MGNYGGDLKLETRNELVILVVFCSGGSNVFG